MHIKRFGRYAKAYSPEPFCVSCRISKNTAPPHQTLRIFVPLLSTFARSYYAPAKRGVQRDNVPLAVGDTSAPVTPFPAVKKFPGTNQMVIRTKEYGSQNNGGENLRPFHFFVQEKVEAANMCRSKDRDGGCKRPRKRSNQPSSSIPESKYNRNA